MKNPATPSVDIWAMGVILYAFLYGTLPFIGENNQAIMEKIVFGEVIYPKNPKISFEAKDLLKKMFNVDYKQRITIHEIFEHPWYQNKKSLKFY